MPDRDVQAAYSHRRARRRLGESIDRGGGNLLPLVIISGFHREISERYTSPGRRGRRRDRDRPQEIPSIRFPILPMRGTVGRGWRDRLYFVADHVRRSSRDTVPPVPTVSFSPSFAWLYVGSGSASICHARRSRYTDSPGVGSPRPRRSARPAPSPVDRRVRQSRRGGGSNRGTRVQRFSRNAVRRSRHRPRAPGVRYRLELGGRFGGYWARSSR